MTYEAGLILSIPEIRLCMNILGCEQWDDLPLIDNGESAEQRLMNAFLHLIKMEKLTSVENGYRMEPDFRRLMLCIGQADQTWCLCEKERVLAFLYGKDSLIAAVSPDWGNQERCRISFYSDTTPDEILGVFSDLSEDQQSLELRMAGYNQAGAGTYEVEKLAYFLGIDSKLEEAK